MIEPRMLGFLDPQDLDARADWARQHMEWHVRIYTEAVKQGFPKYDQFPTIRDMEDLEGWVYYHHLEHQNISHSLAMGDPPDLGEVDPEDIENWNSWLDVHAQVHSDIRSALGII